MKSCSIPECRREGASRQGWCLMHYKRWKRNGDPLALQRATPDTSPEERLRLKGWTVTPSGCWEFNSYDSGPMKHKQVWVDGRDRPAHQVAYEVWVGPIPEGSIIRHRCDNPPCINPAHLEPGTHKDNAGDRDSRGRSGSMKLADEEIREIRAMYSGGNVTQAELAERFGITGGHVSAIVNYKARRAA